VTKPLVIYHGNCPDGFTAAWVAARALGDVELFAGKYGEDPPHELAKGRRVYIVDFSYAREKLEKLFGEVSELYVLDHHKTAEADLAGLPYCSFDMNRSGAGMAWDFFHPGEVRPWIVSYVEDRDLWRFKLPASEEVSLWIRLIPHELEAYDALSQHSLSDIAQAADGASKYLRHYVRDALRNAYDVPGLFAGSDETVRCVNVSYTGISDVLHGALEAGGVRLALGWHLTVEGRIACSLRSTSDVDCSVFAKAHGGGGHAQASGFSVAAASPFARLLLRIGGAS
jgi:nanoRNase/pAp phosphatase (c-di-AMP/oligoRNAs hydrolase)